MNALRAISDGISNLPPQHQFVLIGLVGTLHQLSCKILCQGHRFSEEQCQTLTHPLFQSIYVGCIVFGKIWDYVEKKYKIPDPHQAPLIDPSYTNKKNTHS